MSLVKEKQGDKNVRNKQGDYFLPKYTIDDTRKELH